MTNFNTETKKPLQLEVQTPEKFENLAATTLETTQKLAKRINKLFSTAFVDYHGSIVSCTPGNGNVTPYQQFSVELHFKPVAAGAVSSDDHRVRAFKPIEEAAPGTDIVSGLKSIYGSMRTSDRFELTSEGAQILSEFMLPGIDNGKNVDPWKPATFKSVKAEYVDNNLYGQGPVMIQIRALDLVKLIGKIYGRKSESGMAVEYGVIPYAPVATFNNQAVQYNANWRVMILQINAAKTLDLASECGIIPSGSGGAVVTEF